jgi:hypothetical protein
MLADFISRQAEDGGCPKILRVGSDSNSIGLLQLPFQ